MKKIAVFASGTGSNFEAIDDAINQKRIRAELSILICDKPQAIVIQKAQYRNIPILAISPHNFSTKKEYELTIVKHLQKLQIDLIILAGYMRLIGPTILAKYPRRILNIHPSLLPKFKGLDAVGQAIKAGETVTGVTIHFVDEGMDTGEIILQQTLDISTCLNRSEIETKIHQIEHKLYPKAIQKVLEDL